MGLGARDGARGKGEVIFMKPKGSVEGDKELSKIQHEAAPTLPSPHLSHPTLSPQHTYIMKKRKRWMTIFPRTFWHACQGEYLLTILWFVVQQY